MGDKGIDEAVNGIILFVNGRKVAIVTKTFVFTALYVAICDVFVDYATKS